MQHGHALDRLNLLLRYDGSVSDLNQNSDMAGIGLDTSLEIHKFTLKKSRSRNRHEL